MNPSRPRSTKPGLPPGPPARGPEVELLCSPDLPFSTLLDLHLRLLAGKAPDFDIAWSNIESAQKMEVSLYAFIDWRTGRSLPGPFQLETLVDHLRLSSQFGQDASSHGLQHPHATRCQLALMEAALREAYWRDPMPRPSTSPRDPILKSGRAEFVNWLRERGSTLRQIGDRLDVSKSAVTQLLEVRRARLAKESKHLAGCLQVLRAWASEPTAKPASRWPFPVSIPARCDPNGRAGAAQPSTATKPGIDPTPAATVPRPAPSQPD